MALCTETKAVKNNLEELKKSIAALDAGISKIEREEKRVAVQVVLGTFGDLYAGVIDKRIGTKMRLETIYKLYDYRKLLVGAETGAAQEHFGLVEKLKESERFASRRGKYNQIVPQIRFR
jgi:hypothetical protein